MAVLWLHKRRERFRNLCGTLSSNLAVLFIIAGCVVGVVLLALRLTIGDKPGGWLGGITVEGFGFLFDIILFGIILYALEHRRERKRRIHEYQNQLTDFLRWEGEEAVFRKVGIIRRLNELDGKLPNFDHAYLVGASLDFADLTGTNLCFANLSRADLSGARLQDAFLGFANLDSVNLYKSNLYGANLAFAEHLTFGQLRMAKFWDKAAAYPSNVIEAAKVKGVTLKDAGPPPEPCPF